jgi:death on curing protein
MTFGGEDLYPTLHDKAVAMGLALASDHPFIDANKRTAYVAWRCSSI